MNTDDHILATFLADNQPLDAVAAKLGMTLIALVRWLDRNADLLAAATRAMETRLKFLSLRAEAVAVDDLSAVSRATRDEERKRKSASQLLRHVAKRLFPPPPRKAPGNAPPRPHAAPNAAPDVLMHSGLTPHPAACTVAAHPALAHAPTHAPTTHPAAALSQVSSAPPSHPSATKLPLAARLAAKRLSSLATPASAC